MLLTKDLRTRITKTVMTTASAEAKSRFDVVEDTLARDVIRAVAGDDVFTRVAKIPTGWLPMVKEINVCGPGVHYVYLNLRETITLPCLFKSQVRVSGELADRVAEHLNKRQKRHEQERELYNQISATLTACRTIEKLREVWPEALATLPPEYLVEKKSLPAVIVADLNRKIEAYKASS